MIIVTILMVCFNLSFFGQNLPSGPRLKDIDPTTNFKIGAKPSGAFSTVSSSNLAVLDREFNAIEPAWYPN